LSGILKNEQQESFSGGDGGGIVAHAHVHVDLVFVFVILLLLLSIQGSPSTALLQQLNSREQSKQIREMIILTTDFLLCDEYPKQGVSYSRLRLLQFSHIVSCPNTCSKAAT